MCDKNWFPAGVRVIDGQPVVSMRQIDISEFSDAFVDETMQRVGSAQTFQLLIQPNGSEIDLTKIAPLGIIYHVSKCGSTLAAQLLKSTGKIAVYSQPQAMSDLLMPPHAMRKEELLIALCSLASLFSSHAGRPYVFKLESWNVLFADLLRSAFPDTPWVFCVRDPSEVFVSIIADPDPSIWYQLIGAPENPFATVLTRRVTPNMTPAQYFSLFYSEYCEAVLRLPRNEGRFIAYDKMPSAVWKLIAPHFGLTLSAADLAEMEKAAQLYSKSRHGISQIFIPDTTYKRQQISKDDKRQIDLLASSAFDCVLLRA